MNMNTKDRHFAAPSPEAETLVDVRLTDKQMRDAQKLLAQPKTSPFRYLNHFKLPGDVSNGYKFQITGHSIGEIATAHVYSDAVTGTRAGGDGAPIIIQMITSGGMIFESESQVVKVESGQVGIRETGEKWWVRCAPSTNSRLIIVPRSLLPPDAIRQIHKRARRFDLETPEVQFIANYMELIEEQRRKSPSSATDCIAQYGLASLISSLIRGDNEYGSQDFIDPIIASARRVMDKHLLDDELSPAMIAKEAAVSVRSLHRAFARIDSSVMSEVRQRRLQGAHDDLIDAGFASVVSSVAAKWKFSDSSHFVRHFRAKYGVTPASYVRERLKNAEIS
jgi:AraC-like DNA-binding protein